jgi:DNA-binding HxlR family transcriptional regulator
VVTKRRLDLDPDAVIRPCAARDALDMVSNKWTPLIVWLLSHGTMRFSELKRRVGGISQKMLTQTLRELESANCVRRTVQPTAPVTVEYTLTPLGRTLVKPLFALIEWAHQHAADCGFADPSEPRT